MVHLPDMESTSVDRTLQPGIYKILNDANADCSIDLSGYDMKRVIGKCLYRFEGTALAY
jgi:hypothetical protein